MKSTVTDRLLGSLLLSRHHTLRGEKKPQKPQNPLKTNWTSQQSSSIWSSLLLLLCLPFFLFGSSSGGHSTLKGCRAEPQLTHSMSSPQLHGEPLQGCRASSSFLLSCYQEPASKQGAANKQSKRHEAMSQWLAHKGPGSSAHRGSTTMAMTPLETIPSFHWGNYMLT